MITPNTFTIRDLIRLTGGGIQAATFSQIRASLINKYKEIYGQDIDLSTGNADGEYVNELALLINNILRTIESIYGNLDVNSASGSFLDALCALSNITRKLATRSVASLTLQNLTNSTVVFNITETSFSDQAGNVWNCVDLTPENPNDNSVSIPANGTTTVTAESNDFGQISAPAGWINQMVGYPDIVVTQPNDAIEGQPQESDSELRMRRNRYVSPIGQTVLESLNAALLQIAGVRDVKVYNATEARTAFDGTSITAHSIYAIIRQNNIEDDIESVIGNTIYQKLTPGIPTTQMGGSVTTGTGKSFTVIPTMLGQTVSSLSQTMYWKLAIPIAPTMKIKFKAVLNSGFLASSIKESVYSGVTQYMNGLGIGVDPDFNEIVSAVLLSDPRPKGISTITNISVYNDDGVTQFLAENLDTYFEYNKSEISDPDASGFYTLTISRVVSQ